MAINILQTDIRFPETVYILAPGYEGRNYYRRIPNDAFVITVNYGIEIPGVQKHIWLAEDRRLPELYMWFRDAAREYINKNYLLFEPYPTPVFDSGYLYQLYPNVPYIYHSSMPLGTPKTFKTGSREAWAEYNERQRCKQTGQKYKPPMHKDNDYWIKPGYLRGRATISSKAMQLAVQKGAKRLVLNGVDMRGRKYFDEKTTESGHIVPGDESGSWVFKKRMNALIKTFMAHGIEIVSLSPTALNVPVVEV